MRNKIIAEAEKWVGYLEKASSYKLDSMTANAGSNNYTLFSEWYKNKGYGNYQAQPWCAMFVSYVFGNVIPNSEDVMQHFHYCPTGLKWFEKDYQLSLNPEVGDVVFFRDSKNIACHTGIVYNYDSKTVYTIEGNTSSAAGVVANGGAVAKKSYARNYNKIIGYGRPKWEAVQVESKYSYDDTVDNMIKDGVTTTENMAYWEKVLDGREKINPDSVRAILNRYHGKVK